MRNLVVEISALLRRDGIGRKRLNAALPRLREVHSRLRAGSEEGRWPHLVAPDLVAAQAVADALASSPRLAVVGQPGAIAALQVATHALGTRQPEWVTTPDGGRLAALDGPDVAWLALEGPAWVDRVAEWAVGNGRRVAMAGPGTHEAPPEGWWISDSVAGDGRFGALGTASLVSAAWAGVDIGQILVGATDVSTACGSPALFENPAYTLAVAAATVESDLGAGACAHLVSDARLAPFAAWLARLSGAVLSEHVRADGVGERTGVGGVSGIIGDEELTQLLLIGRRDKLVHVWDTTEGERDGWGLEAALQSRALQELLAQENIPHLRIRVPRLDAATLGGVVMLASHAAVTAALFRELDPLGITGVSAWYAAVERARAN